jgi:putative salt-induced outer membrane protein YdiY
MSHSLFVRLGGSLLLGAYALAPLQAGQPTTPSVTDCGHKVGPWDTSIYTGFSLSQGTVDSLNLNAGVRAIGTWTDREVLLFADYLYAETNSTSDADVFRAGAQYNWLFSERAYVGLRTNFLSDAIADVDYRLSLNPTLGYTLYKNDRARLSVEAGPGYTWEKQSGISRDFMNLRAAERFEWAFENGAKFYQTLEYLPEVEDFGSYLIAAEAGLEVPLSAKLKLRLAARDTYDSTPAAGRDSNDLTLLTGLSYALADAAPAKCKVCRWEAADKPAPKPEQNVWLTTGSIGYTMITGNADAALLTLGLDTVKYTDVDEIRLGALGAYGEADGARNNQMARAKAQYNRVLKGPFYAGLSTDFLHDDVADLSYRITPSALLGAYLIKTETTKLAVEAGPAYTFEKQGGEDANYFSVLVRQRFDTVLNARTKVFQSVAALFNVENGDDYILTGEIGTDVKLVGNFNLRVSLQDIYDPLPAAGAENNELRLVSGISINF